MGNFSDKVSASKSVGGEGGLTDSPFLLQMNVVHLLANNETAVFIYYLYILLYFLLPSNFLKPLNKDKIYESSH